MVDKYRTFTGIVAAVVVTSAIALLVIIKMFSGGDVREKVYVDDTVKVENEEKEPPEEIDDPERIGEAYEEGRTYRRTVEYEIYADGSHKMWGAGIRHDIAYAGSVVIDQTIEKNDGRNIESRLKTSDARTLKARRKWREGFIDIPDRVHYIIKQVARRGEKMLPFDIPELLYDTDAVERRLNTYLESPLVDELTNFIPIQTLEIEDIEGFEFRVNFTDGIGVTAFTLLDYPIRRDFRGLRPHLHLDRIREFLRSFNHTPDFYIFPDEGVDIGEEWPVKAQNLPNIFPPSFNATIEGNITVQRVEDENGMIQLSIPGGDRLTLVARPKKGRTRRVEAEFTMQGEMVYDPEKRIMTEGSFTGKIPIEKRVQGIWIFEMVHETDAKFKSEYRCEVH